MPRSRGRKKKPSTNRRRGPARSGYRPGILVVDEDAIARGLLDVRPDQLVELGLPIWWLSLLVGKPANICLDGAITLTEAFDVLGVRAVPKFVELLVHNPDGSGTRYGRPDPQFAGDQFLGHAGLWLPQSGRFIDFSVQQFPELRAVSWLPVAAPLGVSDWPAQGFIVPRGPYTLEYVPVAEHLNSEILAHAHLAGISAAERRRSGLNLVANYLTLIRHDKLRAKAEAGPHPRVAALLEVIGDAELILDDAQNHRFLMSGGPAGGTPLHELLARVD